MNKELHPKTGNYRELYGTFNSFFYEVRLTYGRGFCREVKREALQDYLRTGDLLGIDELDILHRVNFRHPEIKKWMDQQIRMVLGAVA